MLARATSLFPLDTYVIGVRGLGGKGGGDQLGGGSLAPASFPGLSRVESRHMTPKLSRLIGGRGMAMGGASSQDPTCQAGRL